MKYLLRARNASGIVLHMKSKRCTANNKPEIKVGDRVSVKFLNHTGTVAYINLHSVGVRSGGGIVGQYAPECIVAR